MKKLTLILLPLLGLSLASCEWGRAEPRPPYIPPPVDPSENAFEFKNNSTLLDVINAVTDKNNISQDELISILNNLDSNDDVINQVTYTGLSANYQTFDQPLNKDIFLENITYTLKRYQNDDNSLLLVDGIETRNGYYYDENLVITNYDYTYNRQINRDLINSRYYDFYDDANKSSFVGSYADSYAYLDYVYRDAITLANSSEIKIDAITYVFAASELENYTIEIESKSENDNFEINLIIDQINQNDETTNFRYSFNVTISNGVISSLNQEEKTYYLDAGEEVIKRIDKQSYVYQVNSNQNTFDGGLMDIANFEVVNEK